MKTRLKNEYYLLEVINITTKTRVIIIGVLVLFIFLLFVLTKTFEKRLIQENKTVMKNNEIYKRAKNYKLENNSRYVKYQERNKNLSYTKIVTYVNIGLDYGFYNNVEYTDIKKGKKILINKNLKLNKNYIPNNLDKIDNKYFIYGNNDVRMLKKEAKYYFEKLSKDSIKNNAPIYGQSAYRSYQKQEVLYRKAMQENGKDKADSDTARPGHSEHQTGLAIDVSSTKNGNMLEFEKTKSFIWMKNNSHKYGFILRYPKGKEKIHGYIYEPWHYRYVGIKIAQDMHENHPSLTYDEYYDMYLDK